MMRRLMLGAAALAACLMMTESEAEAGRRRCRGHRSHCYSQCHTVSYSHGCCAPSCCAPCAPACAAPCGDACGSCGGGACGSYGGACGTCGDVCGTTCHRRHRRHRHCAPCATCSTATCSSCTTHAVGYSSSCGSSACAPCGGGAFYGEPAPGGAPTPAPAPAEDAPAPPPEEPRA